MEATTIRASTVMRSIPTNDMRTHASTTMPLSSTLSSTSIRLVPPEALSKAMVDHIFPQPRPILRPPQRHHSQFLQRFLGLIDMSFERSLRLNIKNPMLITERSRSGTVIQTYHGTRLGSRPPVANSRHGPTTPTINP